jgi:hypothetical protein
MADGSRLPDRRCRRKGLSNACAHRRREHRTAATFASLIPTAKDPIGGSGNRSGINLDRLNWLAMKRGRGPWTFAGSRLLSIQYTLAVSKQCRLSRLPSQNL